LIPPSPSSWKEYLNPKAIVRSCCRVDAKGNKILRAWANKRDGKDGPFPSDIADTISIVLAPDRYSSTWVIKKAGKVAGQGKSVISRDGKTMTWTWSGTSPEGKPTSGTTVFDRQ
jgi:hypothetical protein